MIFITGGVGFIGSNFVHQWLASTDEPLAILDKLTYAGNLDNVESVKADPRFSFVQLDICDRLRVSQLLAEHRPRAIVHFAAESHVDRSIHGPSEFIRTNVNGTFELLEAARAYIGGLTATEQDNFRFLHVSTDEVYGSLSATDPAFSESSAYAPNSRMLRARRRPITWCARIRIPITFPRSRPTAAITTGHINFREADSAGALKRPRRKAVAGLWRWGSGAGLVICP